MSNKIQSDSIKSLQMKADNNDAVAMYQLAELLSETEGSITPAFDDVLDYLEKASHSEYKPAAYRMYKIFSGKETVTKITVTSDDLRNKFRKIMRTDFDKALMVYENSARDQEELIGTEKSKISADSEKAILYLKQVSGNNAFMKNAITVLDDESKSIIEGKTAWGHEYSTGDILPRNIEKAVSIATSIINNLEAT